MSNRVYCSKCNESNYTTDSSKIDLNTGTRVGIGSLVGGIVLIIIGLFFVLMGLSPIISPDPKNPLWSGIGYLAFGFFVLIGSGLSLLLKYISKKRIQLNIFKCNNCGNQWNILGEEADEKSIGLLINRLKDKSKDIRKGAAEALSHIADARSKDALIQVLKDEDSEVRYFSVLALGRIGDPDALESLTKALQDEKEAVRRETVLAIASIVIPRPMLSRSIPRLVRPYFETERGSRIRDIENEKLIVEPLIKALTVEHEKIEIRTMAAVLLGKIDDRRAITALTLAKDDKNKDVRWAAEKVLKMIKEDTKEK